MPITRTATRWAVQLVPWVKNPLAVLLVILGVSAAHSHCTEASFLRALISSGSPSHRINFIFLAEGYTTTQREQFFADAQRSGEAILAAAPFHAYRSFFNILAIFVPSAESGSDHPSRDIYRDTYFNSRYDSGGKSHRITIPPNDSDSSYEPGLGKIDALIDRFGLSSAAPILLVNDPEYGGSGGRVPIASMHRSSSHLVLHELGHSFAMLWEEYEGAASGKVDTVNNSSSTNLAAIPWRHWIDPATAIPTPETDAYATVVGLFEGAGGFSIGTYRPKLNCRMRTIDAEFCEVCSEALVLSFYKRRAAADSWAPAAERIVLNSTSTQSVRFLKSPSHPEFSIDWYVDGNLVARGTNSTFLLDLLLPPGEHTLRAVALDHTRLVRADPFHLLRSEREWKVIVPGPTIQFNREGEGAMLTLIWQEAGARYILQTSRSPAPEAAWADLSETIIRESEAARVNILLPGDQQFFRLRQE